MNPSDAAKFLIARGAGVDAGETPAHVAEREGAPELAEWFAERDGAGAGRESP